MAAEIKELLKEMVEAKASDLILEANAPMALRIGGQLRFMKQVYNAAEIGVLLTSILNPTQKIRLENEKQLVCSYELVSGERFRVNLHFQKGSLAAAIRAVPKVVPSRQELRLPEVIEELVKLQNGLIIVTGPTGSGKTTTQACMVDMINQQRAAHILTIEDPIEYIIENKKSLIEQREVGTDAIDFPGALRAALRENPNVILIGEMRDLETISTAITAAETGHLVISTLHTSGVVNAVDRIIDVFPAHQQNQVRSQLSLTLRAILAQELIPRKDKKGVIAAVEVLIGVPAIRNVIRKAQTHEIPTLIEVGKKYGMQTMSEAMLQLLRKGLIELDEALSRVPDPDAFRKRI